MAVTIQNAELVILFVLGYGDIKKRDGFAQKLALSGMGAACHILKPRI